jgi:hypothetical protein
LGYPNYMILASILTLGLFSYLHSSILSFYTKRRLVNLFPLRAYARSFHKVWLSTTKNIIIYLLLLNFCQYFYKLIYFGFGPLLCYAK